MKRKIVIIILVSLLILGLVGGALYFIFFRGTENNPSGQSTDKNQFLKAMDDLCAAGDTLAEQGLSLQADSYYAFAGASVSSMRYAVEYILWLRGEGDSIESFTADSRYSGWDEIASVCYASPYPYYFEGLIYHVQAKNDEAKAAYANTLLNPAYPQDGVNFYYLKNMEIADLYSLRDELREKETEIYGKFTVVQIKVERDPYLFDSEYLRAKSAKAIETADYETAAAYAKIAVANDPMDSENFKNAVLCCIANDDLDKAGEYLDWGILFAPEDKGLKELYTIFEQLGGAAE